MCDACTLEYIGKVCVTVHMWVDFTIFQTTAVLVDYQYLFLLDFKFSQL
jgi:hypothetical protein